MSVRGDAAPRGMTAHDRIRLTGPFAEYSTDSPGGSTPSGLTIFTPIPSSTAEPHSSFPRKTLCADAVSSPAVSEPEHSCAETNGNASWHIASSTSKSLAMQMVSDKPLVPAQWKAACINQSATRCPRRIPEHFASFMLDTANECLWRNGRADRSAAQALFGSALPGRNPGRLIKHDELLDALWPDLRCSRRFCAPTCLSCAKF